MCTCALKTSVLGCFPTSHECHSYAWEKCSAAQESMPWASGTGSATILEEVCGNRGSGN